MAVIEINREAETKPSTSRGVDMKLEVLVIPVSDVDRAKAFYARLGWRLDADFTSGDDWRVIQFTPPGSACSVIFGRNVTAAAARLGARPVSGRLRSRGGTTGSARPRRRSQRAVPRCRRRSCRA
ncbi:catechol 2,3-dioxygenase-like lactoylglutathione lyase family enzyme [Bradyrhizobium ottawaense]